MIPNVGIPRAGRSSPELLRREGSTFPFQEIPAHVTVPDDCRCAERRVQPRADDRRILKISCGPRLLITGKIQAGRGHPALVILLSRESRGCPAADTHPGEALGKAASR